MLMISKREEKIKLSRKYKSQFRIESRGLGLKSRPGQKLVWDFFFTYQLIINQSIDRSINVV